MLLFVWDEWPQYFQAPRTPGGRFRVPLPGRTGVPDHLHALPLEGPGQLQLQTLALGLRGAGRQ